MTRCSRRLVVDSDFETTVGAVTRALRDEGLEMIARVDVRDDFWRNRQEFRRYVLLDAWSPDLAFEALRLNLDAGPLLTTTIAVYELDNGQNVVATRESLAPIADDAVWRAQEPGFAAVADLERARLSRAFEHLRTHAAAAA